MSARDAPLVALNHSVVLRPLPVIPRPAVPANPQILRFAQDDTSFAQDDSRNQQPLLGLGRHGHRMPELPLTVLAIFLGHREYRFEHRHQLTLRRSDDRVGYFGLL